MGSTEAYGLQVGIYRVAQKIGTIKLAPSFVRLNFIKY